VSLITLQAFPKHVYKAPDRSHENIVSWIFSLVVQSTVSLELEPESMEVDLLRQDSVLRHTTYNHGGFAP